jgi:hypothetical protein
VRKRPCLMLLMMLGNGVLLTSADSSSGKT